MLGGFFELVLARSTILDLISADLGDTKIKRSSIVFLYFSLE